ncbi:MAG: SDR family oxidoreductase [Gaiellaceae bacterium]
MSSEHLPLAGDAALVTGASRGIGRATAVELARRGADLALVQRGDAADVVAEIRGLGRRAVVARADLSDPGAADAAVETVAAELGRLDIAVCNAGTVRREPALDVSLEDWRRVVDVNLVATFAVARAAARRFVEQGTGGRIVLNASVLAFQGGWMVSSYAASKAGVANLTHALANEWAALGIRVNAVAPGYVANDQTEPLRADPERNAAISSRIPLGRWATNEEIAAAVAFLVSPEAGYVCGAVLPVDGGWLGR